MGLFLGEKSGGIMKRLLTGVFVVAWLPIVWLLLSSTIGVLLTRFLEPSWLAHVMMLLFSCVGVFWLLQLLNLLKTKVFGEKSLF